MYEFPNYAVFLSLKIIFILANSEEPNEMLHSAAYHLGLHCLPKYRFPIYNGVTLNLLVLSANIFCKQFGTRSGLTKYGT